MLSEKCLCLNGYYENGITLCSTCNFKCQTCVDVDTKCLTCDTYSHRVLDELLNVCACPSDLFEDGEELVCAECDDNCLTC